MKTKAFELKLDAASLALELKINGFDVLFKVMSHAGKKLYLVKWS